MSTTNLVSYISNEVAVHAMVSSSTTIIARVAPKESLFVARVIGGIRGKSAYETWLDLGNIGSEQDFLNSLAGGLYDDSYITQRLDSIEQTLPTKVTAISGMGLSSNDYTTADKNKLAALISDRHYKHTQMAAEAIWVINHNLGKRPAVTTFNNYNIEVIGDIEHISDNQLTITFIGAFSGYAYLN